MRSPASGALLARGDCDGCWLLRKGRAVVPWPIAWSGAARGPAQGRLSEKRRLPTAIQPSGDPAWPPLHSKVRGREEGNRYGDRRPYPFP